MGLTTRFALPRLALLWPLLGGLHLAGCQDLPALPADSCGNGVIDTNLGEECDTFAPGDRTRCGQPGEAFACHFVCSRDPKKNLDCPPDLGCGLDGLCRRAATPPAFVAVKPDATAQSTRLQPGDFDGDGRVDLLAAGEADPLGQLSASLMFFGNRGVVATSVAIPGLIGSPAVGPLTRGGLDDLAFSSLPGLSVLVSRPDRTLQPRGYPFDSIVSSDEIRVVPMDALPTAADGSQAQDELLMLTGNELQIFGGQKLATLDSDVSGLVGEAAVGRLLSQSTFPCEQLVVAFSTASSFKVYSPCQAQKGKPDPAKSVGYGVDPVFAVVVALEAGTGQETSIQGAPLVFDLNKDGFDDILIGSHIDIPFDPDNPDLAVIFDTVAFVAYGTGKDFFVGLPPDNPDSKAFKNIALPHTIDLWAKDKKGDFGTQKSFVPHPLAVGFLDGDSLPDFVTPYLLAVSGNPQQVLDQPASSYTLTLVGNGSGWSEALINDFNQDGTMDIVAASLNKPALDVYLGTGAGIFNPSSVLLTGQPSLLRLGDFDGDQVPDVAFSEQGARNSPQDQRGDALAVLFGRRDGYPDNVVRMGRFDFIREIVTGDINLLGFDRMSDVGVISNKNAEKTRDYSLALAFGTSDRQMRAPLSLLSPSEKQDNITLPLGLAVGKLVDHGQGGGRDLAVASFLPPKDESSTTGAWKSSEFRLWSVSFHEDGSFAAMVASAPLGDGINLGVERTFNEMNGQILAGNLDRESTGAAALDEMILVTPQVNSSAPQPKDTTILIGRVRGTVDQPESLSLPTSQIVLPGLVVDSDGRALLADLDGDKLLDLVLIGQDSSNAAALWVALNDGQGAFRVDRPLKIPLPENKDYNIPDPPLDLCVLNAGTRQASLVVLGLGGVYQVPFSTSPVVRSLIAADAMLPGAISVACGDMDGDGVADIAAGDGSQVRLHLGQVAHP
jgi:hypothetical protein